MLLREEEEVDDIEGHGCDEFPKADLTVTEEEEEDDDDRGDAKDGRDGAVVRRLGLAIAILQGWKPVGELEEEMMHRISLRLLLVDTTL